MAEKNDGVDWKAISHAYRCLIQMKHLFEDKTIKFPLQEAPYLLNVKQGNCSWKDCEQEIINGLEEVDKLKYHCDWDYKDDIFVNQSLINLFVGF